MSAVTGTTGSVELPSDPTILELTGGENPLRFLEMDETDTALGVIAWMEDPDRIEGWRQAEIQSSGDPRSIIIGALYKQERALEAGASLPVYHEDHRRSTKIVETTDADDEPQASDEVDGGAE